jgi:hypothetical protein
MLFKREITGKDKEMLLERVPNIELFYEEVVHRKIHKFDLVMGIPKGRKCFIWFTYYNEEKVCLLLNYKYEQQQYSVTNIYIITCAFDTSLCLGTILYGTLFNVNKNNFICVENICYYKGNNIVKKNMKNKLDIISILFESEIKQVLLTKNMISFGLPLMHTNKIELIASMEKQHYDFFNISYINLNGFPKIYTNKYISKKFTNNYDNAPKMNFRVTPSIQNDIYKLHCYHKGSIEHYIDIAHIPDYKTSVKLNKLFRNIKENINLDYLEESDDDEEFENIDIDKYVDLNKAIHMSCAYNYRFKKWVPMEVCERNKGKLSTLHELNEFKHSNK